MKRIRFIYVSYDPRLCSCPRQNRRRYGETPIMAHSPKVEQLDASHLKIRHIAGDQREPMLQGRRTNQPITLRARVWHMQRSAASGHGRIHSQHTTLKRGHDLRVQQGAQRARHGAIRRQRWCPAGTSVELRHLQADVCTWRLKRDLVTRQGQQVHDGDTGFRVDLLAWVAAINGGWHQTVVSNTRCQGMPSRHTKVLAVGRNEIDS